MNLKKMMDNLTTNHWIAFFVLIALIYILIKFFNAQQMTIEGITNKNKESPFEQSFASEISKALKDTNDIDSMVNSVVNPNKQNLEELIMRLDESNSLNMLIMLPEMAQGPSPTSEQVSLFNNGYQFKQALNSAMEYLDGKSGTSSAVNKASSYFS